MRLLFRESLAGCLILTQSTGVLDGQSRVSQAYLAEVDRLLATIEQAVEDNDVHLLRNHTTEAGFGRLITVRPRAARPTRVVREDRVRNKVEFVRELLGTPLLALSDAHGIVLFGWRDETVRVVSVGRRDYGLVLLDGIEVVRPPDDVWLAADPGTMPTLYATCLGAVDRDLMVASYFLPEARRYLTSEPTVQPAGVSTRPETREQIDDCVRSLLDPTRSARPSRQPAPPVRVTGRAAPVTCDAFLRRYVFDADSLLEESYLADWSDSSPVDPNNEDFRLDDAALRMHAQMLNTIVHVTPNHLATHDTLRARYARAARQLEVGAHPREYTNRQEMCAAGQLIEDHPNDWRAFSHAAEFARRTEDYDRALELLWAAERTSGPDHLAVNHHRAFVYFGQRRYAEAILAYRIARTYREPGTPLFPFLANGFWEDLMCGLLFVTSKQFDALQGRARRAADGCRIGHYRIPGD